MPNFIIVKNNKVINKQVFDSLENAIALSGDNVTVLEENDTNSFVSNGYVWNGETFIYGEPDVIGRSEEQIDESIIS